MITSTLKTFPIKTITLTFLILFSSGSVTHAERLPGVEGIEDLEQSKQWLLEVDGRTIEPLEIYYSDYHVAWLLKEPRQGWLLISPRGDSVQGVSQDGIKSGASTATLDAGSTTELLATFSTSQGVMSFEIDGRAYALKPAPPMLGRQTLRTVQERHPGFAAKASSYKTVAARQQVPTKAVMDDLTVKVYFGSWSEICERIVPKILGVEQQWQNVHFEYYGLPKPLIDDPHAVDQRITGVPTVLVLKDGEEIERLTGRQLDDPATALAGALARP